MLRIEELSQKYKVRNLTKADAAMIYELCIGNPQFYEHCPPFVTCESIIRDMHALPPRTTEAHKHYLGFFEGEKLVAVLDLITDFPNEQTVFWGFFMIDKAYQGKGIASALVDELCACLAEDYSAVRLGYVKTNTQSEHFWRKNGFVDTGIENNEELYTVVVLERKLR